MIYPESSIVYQNNGLYFCHNGLIHNMNMKVGNVLDIVLGRNEIFVLTDSELISIYNDDVKRINVDNGKGLFTLNDYVYVVTGECIFRYNADLLCKITCKLKPATFHQFADIVFMSHPSTSNMDDSNNEI